MDLDAPLDALFDRSGVLAIDWRRGGGAPSGDRVRLWQHGASPAFFDILRGGLFGSPLPVDLHAQRRLADACARLAATPGLARCVASRDGHLAIGERTEIRLRDAALSPDDPRPFQALPEGRFILCVGAPAHQRLARASAEGIPVLDAGGCAWLVQGRATDRPTEALVWRLGHALLLHAAGVLPPLFVRLPEPR